MTERTPRALRIGFETGRLTADDVIDLSLSALDAETITTRQDALEALVVATTARPDRATDVFDEVASAVGTGAGLTRSELVLLGKLGRRRPRAFTAVLETVRPLLANPDQSSVDTPLLAAVLGTVGTEAPGVVKPALDTLVSRTDTSRPTLRTETAWAVVRVATTEPAMLRPLIAGLVWDLDDENPETIVRAAALLGQVGRYLPEHLAGLDTLASLLDHPVPDVRLNATEAFGSIAGTGADSAAGIPAPERVDPYLDAITARTADPDPEVRVAAVGTLRQITRHGSSDDLVSVDVFLRAVDDDNRDVRLAGLDALTEAFDPSVIDDDALWRHVVPRLTDGDDDVVAATVNCLLTAVRELAAERPTTARRMLDLLVWFRLSPHGGYGVPDPLDALEEPLVSLADVDLYLRVARSLRDVDDAPDRHAIVSLCATVAVHSDRHRLRAVGVLQALLADEDESVRREVLASFETLAEEVSALRPVLAAVARSVVAYDPPVRARAVSVLAVTGWTDDPSRQSPVDVQRAVLRDRREEAMSGEDDDMSDGLDVVGSESETEPLLALARAWPTSVADAAPALVEHLSVEGEHAEYVARALTTAVAGGGALDDATVHEIESAVQSTDVSQATLAWLSTLILLEADHANRHDRARDRLHSLAEQRVEAPVLSCLELLADHQPEFVAELLVSFPDGPTLSTERAERLARIATGHPRLLLRCRSDHWEGSGLPGRQARAGEYRSRWLAALAETAPHTVPASDWLAAGLWKDDAEATATLLRTVGRPDALGDGPDLETWRQHPSPAVRDAADRIQTADGGDRSIDASAASPETVGEIAAGLAAPSETQCRRASERLVSIAVGDPSLRAAVRQHLLASTVALDEMAAPRSVLGALATVAPRYDLPGESSDSSDPHSGSVDPRTNRAFLATDPTVDVVPLLCQYATAGTAGVRDVALGAMRVRDGVGGETVRDVLTDRLRDADAVVRAQAAQTVAALVDEGLAVTSDLVDALVDVLNGPRYVTIPACEALGYCGATAPQTTARVVDTLVVRLRARERGVRQAAARAIERIGHAEPDSLAPVVGRLCDRVVVDRVTRPALLPALSVAPVSEPEQIERLVEPALSALVSETDPPVTRAAGRLLTTAVSTTPGTVHRQLHSVGEQLREEYDDTIVSGFRDVSPSALSTYWLLRTVGQCAREKHTASDPFGWVLSEAVEYLDPSSSSSPEYDLQRDGVTVEGLATATARAAGFGSHESYETILASWPDDPTKPALEPEATAGFLVHTDASRRAAALETITTGVGSDHRDDVLATLLDQPINLNRYEPVFETLTELLPETADQHLCRRAVETLLDAAGAHNWEIRVNAIRTLATLGTTAAVAADEVIAHLLGLTSQGDRSQDAIAAGIVDVLPHATLSPITICRSTVAAYERSDRRPGRRRTTVATAGRLAERHATVRSTAVETLVAALSDSDRWVRERAATALAEVADIDPAALGPHYGRIADAAATGSGEIADTLDACLSDTAEGP